MKTVSDRSTDGQKAVAPPSRGNSLKTAATAPLLTHCENCGAQLQGRWCAQCGQPAIDYRTFWEASCSFLRRPMESSPRISSRLIFRPGALAELRAELERGNVAPEIRDKFEQALGGKPIPAGERSELEQQLKNPDLPQIARYAIQQRLAHGDPLPDARAKLQEAMKALTPEMRARVESSLTRVQENVTLFHSDKSQKSNDLAEWFQERAREKFGEHGTNIRLFLVALVSNLPYMMLVCIPLFACVLKLLYIRRRVFYVDHLIYALHVHTFAYLGIVLIVLATIGLGSAAPGPVAGWLTALLWLAFLAQIFLSIRRVYQQGWFISICKFLFGGFVYFLVLVAALAATFVITLATP